MSTPKCRLPAVCICLAEMPCDLPSGHRGNHKGSCHTWVANGFPEVKQPERKPVQGVLL